MFGFLKKIIHNKMIGNMEKELSAFIQSLRCMTNEEIGVVVLNATVVRNIYFKNSNIDFRNPIAELERDPYIILKLNRTIQDCKNKKQFINAGTHMVWLHTFRSTSQPEILTLGKELWKELSRGIEYLNANNHVVQNCTTELVDTSGYNLIPAGLNFAKEISVNKNFDDTSIESALIVFNSTASTIIRNETMQDLRVINKVKRCLVKNYNIEEIILITYTLDVALIFDECFACNDLLANLEIQKNILKSVPGDLFREWQRHGKVTKNSVELVLEIIHRFKPDTMIDTRNVIFDFLNNRNSLPDNFYQLLKIIDNRSIVRKALKTINIHFGTEYESNASFCINASVQIMRKILESANVDINTICSDESLDDIFVCGLFLFVFSNHLTMIIEEFFEAVSSVCIRNFFGENIFNQHMGAIVTIYNKIQSSSDMTNEIGSNFAQWINAPDDHKFHKLIEMYSRANEFSKNTA